MDIKKRVFWLLVPFSIVISLDQYSKYLAKVNLKGSGVDNYLGGLFKLMYAENRGAWGSIGSNLDDVWRIIILIVIPCLALLAFAFFTLKNNKMSKSEVFSYALIIAGGVGNVIDRIIYNYVIDFMYIGYKSIGTNIFNIADLAIMTGVSILVIQSIRQKLDKKAQVKS